MSRSCVVRGRAVVGVFVARRAALGRRCCFWRRVRRFISPRRARCWRSTPICAPCSCARTRPAGRCRRGEGAPPTRASGWGRCWGWRRSRSSACRRRQACGEAVCVLRRRGGARLLLVLREERLCRGLRARRARAHPARGAGDYARACAASRALIDAGDSPGSAAASFTRAPEGLRLTRSAAPSTAPLGRRARRR